MVMKTEKDINQNPFLGYSTSAANCGTAWAAANVLNVLKLLKLFGKMKAADKNKCLLISILLCQMCLVVCA